MEIDKKGLTDEEIQELIDNEKIKRQLEDAYVVARVQQEIFNVFFNVLKEAKEQTPKRGRLEGRGIQ